jgi:hypothetical protein
MEFWNSKKWCSDSTKTGGKRCVVCPTLVRVQLLFHHRFLLTSAPFLHVSAMSSSPRSPPFFTLLAVRQSLVSQPHCAAILLACRFIDAMADGCVYIDLCIVCAWVLVRRCVYPWICHHRVRVTVCIFGRERLELVFVLF